MLIQKSRMRKSNQQVMLTIAIDDNLSFGTTYHTVQWYLHRRSHQLPAPAIVGHDGQEGLFVGAIPPF